MMIRVVLTRDRLLALSAGLALFLGFADLARGGVTLAPVLLVAGYLVLVPLSLWPGRRQHAASPTPKRPQRVAERRLTSHRRGLLLASPVLLVAFVPLVANWQHAPRSGDYTTAAFAQDLLNSVEPYGVLVTYGDNDTFPLWYVHEVEGIRKDVTVAVLSLLNTDWYVRGIIRRPIYQYDWAKGPAIYRDGSWPKPTRRGRLDSGLRSAA
ncbi:MAG: hypothetical protein ACJ796_07905 [Gemmatimonadaceae bacterium]